MIPPPSLVLDAETARRQRRCDPDHTPSPAQPLRSKVALRIRGQFAPPEIVVHDTRREASWRVAMVQHPDDSMLWTAVLRMPAYPTIVHYHFEFADGSNFLALRQIESLIPASPDPRFNEWTRKPFQIAVYDPDQMPASWTQGQVIYQIFPDRFAKADVPMPRPRIAQHCHGREYIDLPWGEMPEIPAKGRDFFAGNLRGICEKLDYLHDMGVDCIYLTPIFESPSNHRYDAMDYFAIDPVLGSEQDLRDLIEGLHQRGMRIMLDAVFNHCSNDSKYFNQSGWYGEAAGATRSKNSPYYRWFEFEEWPHKYSGWFGVQSMPELVECPEHEEYFLGPDGVSNYWLRAGIDGWRTDVTPWMTDEFWRRMRRSVHATNPEAYLVAEEWNDASHYLVGDSYDATMNYRFAWALRGFFALDALNVADFAERLDILRADTPAPALLSQLNLIDSHDTARALTICKGDKYRFTQMVAFLLSYPGAPMICYGDEVGIEGAFAEDSRRTYKWENGDQDLLSFYRRALAFRRRSRALKTGDFRCLWVGEEQRSYVFSRTTSSETVIAAFNAGDQPAIISVETTHAGRWCDELGLHPDVETHEGHLTFTIDPRRSAWYASS